MLLCPVKIQCVVLVYRIPSCSNDSFLLFCLQTKIPANAKNPKTATPTIAPAITPVLLPFFFAAELRTVGVKSDRKFT